MSRNIRIRTEPNGGDKQVKIQLNQDFDFLEILSLKISQEDVYRSFYSDYGVVVGRVIVNSGVGVPNARVSIFIPLSEEDAEDPEISSIYPYTDLQVVNDDGVRYNTLPKDGTGECFTPIGTFPTKREIIDNEPLFEVFEKYYKYTTTTNGAGDFMLFGIPVGNHVLNVDVDLSDVGIYSQRPYDFIEQGNPAKLFASPTKFKGGNNLNNLTQVKNRQVGINVIPFWGEEMNNEIGISRVDVDLNYNLAPKAIFVGSIFGDNQKNSVNKNCRPRRKLGNVCEMGEGAGTIEIIRKNLFGETERYDVEGGQVIDENGNWAFQLPMNLDYMVTDEFGDLRPSEDPNKGIPTRTRARFKISLNETGGNGRLRTRAKYLVPHNPTSINFVDYSFDETTNDVHFKDMYWNKIYTIKNYVARFQPNDRRKNRNFIGFKDVDDCVGEKNPIPFNKISTTFNPIYLLLCIFVTFFIDIISFLNGIISKKFLGIKPFCFLGCIGITCPGNDKRYAPNCDDCGNKGLTSKEQAKNCFKLELASIFNVFKFDFYNDWLNGSLYPFLLKYKKVKNTENFCGDGKGDGKNFIVDTLLPKQSFSQSEATDINEGVIVSKEGELFYKPITNTGNKFYATDFYNLGSVFSCDWQGLPKIQNELVNTTYQIPPLTNEFDPNEPETRVSTIIDLLFDLECGEPRVRGPQITSIKRICEIGVGLDEGANSNNQIDSQDIENILLRSNLIKLNTSTYSLTSVNDIDPTFGENTAYADYRNLKSVNKINEFSNSFYFYFGTQPNTTALDLMNQKYFTNCFKLEENVITIFGSVSDVTTVNGQNGSITITNIQGGMAPYTYKWYNFENQNILLPTTDGGKTIENIAAGKYLVVVTDANGNTSKKIFAVSGISDLSVVTRVRNTADSISSNGILYIESIGGGIGPYDITLVGPNQNITLNNIQNSTTITGLDDGTYTLTITDVNSSVDPLVKTITIAIPTPLDVNYTKENTTCSNTSDGKLTVSVQGGTPEYSIVVRNITNPSNIVIVVNTFIDNNLFEYTDLEAGTYDFVVSDSFGQSFTQQFTIIQTPNPFLTRIGNDIQASNLIVGTSYQLVLGNSQVGGPFVASSTTQLITNVPAGTELYQLVSEDNCASNEII